MKNFVGFLVVLATAVAATTAVEDVVQLSSVAGAKPEFRKLGIFREIAAANIEKGVDITGSKEKDSNEDCNGGRDCDDDESEPWMVIGVVVGAAVVLALVGFVGVMMYRRRSQQRVAAVAINGGGNTRFATGPPQTSVAFSQQGPAPIIVVKPAPTTDYHETFVVPDMRVPKGHPESNHSDYGEPQPHSSNSREPAYNPEYLELDPIDHFNMVEVDLQEPPPAYDEIAKSDNSPDWTYELYVDPETKSGRY